MIKRLIGAVNEYIRSCDRLLWLFAVTAAVYGLVLIASIQRGGGPDFLKTQIAAMCTGFCGAVVISLTDCRSIARLWWLWAGVSLALTVSVFFIGIQVSGTDDVGWLRLPFGVTFQPSELVKLCFIMTLSKHLAVLEERGRLKSFFGAATLLLHAAVPIGLIHLQGDDGAALIFALMFIIISFSSGVQLRYFIIAGAVTAAAVPFVWLRVMNSDQKSRLTALFSSDDEVLLNYGYQQYQGRISIASGGAYGRGLFQGARVARGAVPYQENDFIFTAAGEELGYIGCVCIVILFALMLIRILYIASRQTDPLCRNICVGVFALIGSQAVINLGMVLGLLPVIGITLPFFSSGGTSAVCTCLAVGLVQSAAREHPGRVGGTAGLTRISNWSQKK